ncbi:hypothetical protein Cflav_PD4871 [Pedosphaera parvula Ellin514]|uniref:Uncharacterized protein n=1 Tax=Pedosphaera parvula (strain Ellin514) TaxID=320771 RepID=B9XCP0_PEDPL|nr:hypothetical protein Cflav_PD4871 [Pedosphaera parvula Ellin514]
MNLKRHELGWGVQADGIDVERVEKELLCGHR